MPSDNMSCPCPFLLWFSLFLFKAYMEADQPERAVKVLEEHMQWLLERIGISGLRLEQTTH